MRLLRCAYEWIAFVLALVILVTMQLVWSVGATIAWHALSHGRRRRVGRLFISRLFRHFFVLTGWLNILKVDATALDTLDRDEAMIIAANHPSVLDALVLISRLENLSCIMKASVLDNVLLGPGARLAGYIRNDAPHRMLRLSAAELKRGGQLIVFPEATRTTAAPVNAFKGGFAVIARIARVPVQTVFIETNTPFLSKGWPVFRKPAHCPMSFRVRIGRRFEVTDELAPFVNRLRDYFVDELQDAELGDLWSRTPPVPVPRPFAYPLHCPELGDVVDDAVAHVDGEDEVVAPSWRPAGSH